MNVQKNEYYTLTPDEVINKITKDFVNERQLSKYIDENIELFCNDILQDTYVNHKKEFTINKRKGKTSCIDFFIKCKNGNYAIELKNPKNRNELNGAIGQLLFYELLFEKSKIKIDKFFLISTLHNPLIPEIIDKNNLNIKYVLFCKKLILEYVRPA